MDDRIDRIVQGRYRIRSRIASGAMGVVYLGERVGLGRAVAIKFLTREAADHPDMHRRFVDEARAASRLNHPNCVPVIDYGVDLGGPFVVMEYVPGGTLRDIVDEGPITVPRGHSASDARSSRGSPTRTRTA